MNVIFLTGEKNSGFGSTFLRAQQMRDIVCSRLYNSGHNSWVTSDVTRCVSSKVVVHKTFLIEKGVDGLHALKLQNNVVLADPVDMKCDATTFQHCDAVIASSTMQFDHFTKEKDFNQRVFYVPHHVDMRVPHDFCQLDYFSCVYVGDWNNTRYLTQLSGEKLCAFIDATKFHVSSWIKTMPRHNCHWIVRQSRAWDGFKPFTKGALAAHCGAVLIAADDDIEALKVLGPDYPFFFGVESADDAVKAVMQVKSEFNTQTWRLARHILDEVKWRFSVERVSEALYRALISV